MKIEIDKLDNTFDNVGKTVNTFYDDKNMKVITNEFVRWNDTNMFHDTGQSRKDVKTQTNYSKGEVIGRNTYFEYAYEYNISGKIRPFEYTADNRSDDLEQLQVNLLEKELNK